MALRLDNPDPLTYVAHLRRGVRFHDGHELTAADVVYTYGAFLDPAYVSPHKGAFSSLQSVTALDDYTVEFRLKDAVHRVSNAARAAAAGRPGWLGGCAPHVPDRHRALPLRRYAADDHVTLSAFEGYFDGLPNNAGLVSRSCPTTRCAAWSCAAARWTSVVNDLPPDIVHQLRREDDLQSTTSPGLDFSYVGINFRDPVLADRRVRQALGYAIDRQAIVDHLRRGLARLATGLVPSQGWAYEPDVDQFTYDPAKAQALLEEAGYRDPDGSGPLPRLRLSLICSTNEETRLQSAIIQENLKRVGIDLEVRSYEFATFYQDVLQGRFQLFSLQWVGGALVDPDILRRVYHSSQIPPAGFNRGYYSNPEVDRVLDAAAAATSDGERQRLYSEVQRLVARDAVYIPVWNKTNVVVASRSLAGLHIGATGDLLGLRDVKRATSR